MKKLLVLAILVLASCKKDDTTVNPTSYEGKWSVQSWMYKAYTLENGDTTVHEYKYFNGASNDYFDFQIDKGKGDAEMNFNNGGYSYNYEFMTPAVFKLDEMVCEITRLNDTSFQFNGIHFDPVTIKDKILVRQNFYTLKR